LFPAFISLEDWGVILATFPAPWGAFYLLFRMCGWGAQPPQMSRRGQLSEYKSFSPFLPNTAGQIQCSRFKCLQT